MLEFTKMHALGNDFVMLDGVRHVVDLTSAQIKGLADRHRGIGCDQVIVAERGRDGTDFHMRVFNADGGEVGQCGNGARCLGVWVVQQQLTSSRKLLISTATTRLELEVRTEQQVQLKTAEPDFTLAAVPFQAEHDESLHSIEVDGERVTFSVVSVGNPHAVILVENLDKVPLSQWGPAIENHHRFPEGTNVEFLLPLARDRLALRVWERGVGETLACGSGACAAMVTAHRLGLVDDCVAVELPGGIATVRWSGSGAVFLDGPVTTVYQGQIEPTQI